MCGKETQLFSTEIEGTILNVCVDCSKFGTILQKVKERTEEMTKQLVDLEEQVDVVKIPLKEIMMVYYFLLGI